MSLWDYSLRGLWLLAFTPILLKVFEKGIDKVPQHRDNERTSSSGHLRFISHTSEGMLIAEMPFYIVFSACFGIAILFIGEMGITQEQYWRW